MSTGPLCEPFQKDETTTTIVYFCTRSKPDAYSHLAGFGIAVDAKAWNEIPKDIVKKQAPSIEEFCFIRLLRRIVERVKRANSDESLTVMFDCDRASTSARFQRFIALRDSYPEAAQYLSAFTIGEPKRFMGLQAADFLAWETRKELLRKMGGFESRPEFEHMMLALPGFFPDYESEFWTREKLREHIYPRLAKAESETV
jgi:hypothetical protein